MGEAFEKGLGVFALALPGVGDFAGTEQGVGHFSWGLVLAVEDVVHRWFWSYLVTSRQVFICLVSSGLVKSTKLGHLPPLSINGV